MARSSRTSRAPASSEPAALDEADSALFAALRELRDRLRRGKPAYTVFDNATLLGIVAVRPATLAELARVRGVGPAKLEQYGQEVLAVVAEHGTGGSAAGS
jgi:DNA helicase-2/ATP-dependent DNA helicase PcrA